MCNFLSRSYVLIDHQLASSTKIEFSITLKINIIEVIIIGIIIALHDFFVLVIVIIDIILK